MTAPMTLLPCPFCWEKLVFKKGIHVTQADHWEHATNDCIASYIQIAATDDARADEWNTRPASPLLAEVEVISLHVMDLVRTHGSTMTNLEIVQKFLPLQRLAAPALAEVAVPRAKLDRWLEALQFEQGGEPIGTYTAEAIADIKALLAARPSGRK